MDWSTMEAIVNKLGGLEGVRRFLAGKSTVVDVTYLDTPEKEVAERVSYLGQANVASQLAQRFETIQLGKVWKSTELLEMVRAINADLVKPGEPTWRLPTKAELVAVAHASGSRFGQWYAWSGDIDTSAPNCLWIVNMRDGRIIGDSSGCQVSAYIVKTGVCKYKP